MSAGKSVTLFIPTFAAGGAERVTINLAAALTATGHKVTILTQRPDGPLVNTIPPNIAVATLGGNRSLLSFLPLMRYMQRAKPDVFIANMGHGNIISLWARTLAKMPMRLLCCQHSLLSAETKAHKNWQYKILPLLYRIFLPWADGIVAVSNAVAVDLAETAHIPLDKITVIYNPIVGPDFAEKSRQKNSHPWFAENAPPVILGIGRLSEEKDFTTLIKAFALARKNKDLRLVILGEGSKRSELQQLAKQLGIDEYVLLPGFQPNPLPFIRNAALVAVSSHYEGMSNVVVEALACGTNIVSTNCGGPPEILEAGRYGKLVPVGDDTAMATAMLETLDHPQDATLLRQRGIHFTFERAAGLYTQLF